MLGWRKNVPPPTGIVPTVISMNTSFGITHTLTLDAQAAASAFASLTENELSALPAERSPAWVRIEHDRLLVGVASRRWVSCPLWWFPRLESASEAVRQHYELSPLGIHWPGVDEDISAAGLFAGRGDITRQSGLRHHFQAMPEPTVIDTRHTRQSIELALSDGRCLSVPLSQILSVSDSELLDTGPVGRELI